MDERAFCLVYTNIYSTWLKNILYGSLGNGASESILRMIAMKLPRLTNNILYF